MTTTSTLNPGSSTSPPVRRRRRRWMPRSLAELRSMLMSWWYRAAGGELRAAYLDARRVPGWMVAGFLAVAWPVSGFSLAPVGIGAGLWLALVMLAHPPLRRGFARLLVPWWWRRTIRRTARPIVAVVAITVLAVQAGPLAWGLAVGLWLVFAGLTDNWRARRRLLDWTLSGIASTTRVDPGELRVEEAEWDGPRRRHLTHALVAHTAALHTEDQAARERITNAIRWQLRHVGDYVVDWPAGSRLIEITAQPALPEFVPDQIWADGLPGIPLGVTDLAEADGVYEERDEASGETLMRLPLLLLDPARPKHLLAVGGTGAGKTAFTRGLIARGIRLGHYPGGVFIFDGKGSSDYIAFEGREGVQCVARDPEEWAQNLPIVSRMMRARYDEDVDYERGNRPKPYHPRYLVVLEEVQQIRGELGRDTVDPFLNQLARQMRGSEGRLLLITQRPDTEDAIPGPVRDMLEDRVILGFVSATGARMVLENEWRAIVDEYGADTVPGRGVARIGGRLRRFQSLWLDTPRRDPKTAILYPRRAQEDRDDAERPQPAAPSQEARWAPQPAPEDAESDAEGERPGGFPQPPEDATSASSRPRRRRTV